MERLDKIIALGAGISRADARRRILKGEVCLDGSPVRDIARRLDPAAASITLAGQRIDYREHLYIMMNKPKGVLSATEDPTRKTVLDLLPDSLRRRGLFPVGRLDRDTTGLLLITDDGNFAHMLLSPSKRVPKQYIAGLDADIDGAVVDGFAKGLTLADGTRLAPAKLEPLDHNATVLVTVTEGKYHQIKRMFGLFGIGVVSLKRISFAGLRLPEDLAQGMARELSLQEYQQIIDTKIRTK